MQPREVWVPFAGGRLFCRDAGAGRPEDVSLESEIDDLERVRAT